MAIIKFSPDILRGTATSIQGFMVNYGNGAFTQAFGVVSATYGWWSAGANNNFTGVVNNLGLLRIMSGTRPTNIESLTTTALPGGTTVLWQAAAFDWNTAIAGGNQIFGPTGNNWFTNPTVISSSFVATIGTGVATWFWICTTVGGRATPTPNPSTVVHNITGDIGTVGSGSDMEMLNTSIVTGQFLRVININIGIPTGFFT